MKIKILFIDKGAFLEDSRGLETRKGGCRKVQLYLRTLTQRTFKVGLIMGQKSKMHPWGYCQKKLLTEFQVVKI